MNQNPIIMTVAFQARPGKEAELRELLTEVVTPTRREDGCLFYDLHVSTDDPSKLLFHESWASKAHHAAHDQTPHIQKLRSRIGELSLPAIKSYWEKIEI
jgi:quinol monooxygenase YgiN